MSQQYTPAGVAPALGPPLRRINWRRGLWLTVIVTFITLCGIAFLAFIGWHIGPKAFTIGLVSAILPVPLLVVCFLWLDRYEPEPVAYLAFSFAWGACVATALSLLVNSVMAEVADARGIPESIVAVLVAPFIEETTKALGPLLLFALRRKAFSGIIDAIVYCGLSATGFAMMENILYLGGLGYGKTAEQYGEATGWVALLSIFVVRVGMTGFAHPLFTSMTAIGLGIAARSGDRRIRWFAPLAGLLVAMMLHGTWNLMATVSEQTNPLVILYGYFGVMMPIFFGMVGFALWLRASEGRLAERVLPEYVRAGWLSPPEVTAVGPFGRRIAAQRWAKRVAGDMGNRAMRAYQFDATKLAILRDRMRRGIGTGPNEIEQTLAEERRLLSNISAYRQVYDHRDPAAPNAMWDGARYHLTLPDGTVRLLDPPVAPVVPVPVVVPAPPPFGPPQPAMAYPYR